MFKKLTLTSFLSIIIFAEGLVIPTIKWPCKNFPLNSIAFEWVGMRKIMKKNNLNIILLSIHHQPIMKFL